MAAMLLLPFNERGRKRGVDSDIELIGNDALHRWQRPQ
jgi:hypothetical protein